MNTEAAASQQDSVRSNASSQSLSRFARCFKKRKDPEENESGPEYHPVPYWQLFKYAKRGEKLMVVASAITAAIHGALTPVLITTFGSVLDDFGRALVDPSDPEFVEVTDITATYETTSNLVLGLAFASLFLSFIQLYLSLSAANRIGNTLRKRFFESLLSQSSDFYDENDPGALSHLIENDINLIQGGIGDKLVTTIQYFTTFVGGVIVAFAYGWKLSLVLLAVTPAIFLTGLIFGNASAEATGKGLGGYAQAGGIATEVLSMIRIVTAFGGQEEEARRYEANLAKALRSTIRATISSALGIGVALFVIFSTYALAFWYGSRLVRSDEMTPGDVLLVFLSIAIGASMLGTAGPAFKAFAVARAAAPRVFHIIEQESPINPLDDGGLIPKTPAKGHITLEDVNFNYKKRITEEGQSDMVLENFNLDIPPGSAEAFVGKSGCGKSTIARLIMRLYDPLSGRVLLDGTDIRDLNVRWLRSQIGVVAQTPSLFMMTIRDNIALGAGMDFHVDEKDGSCSVTRQQVTDKDIIEAARMANAHEFISKLPEGYNTMLGERGAMLSGGQRQRICIARALLRKPKILLLDECSSSLDAASEARVQEALDRVSSGRTTITIAHRLSTIRNATSISFISDGKIVERGNHETLLKIPKGFYSNLIELQNVGADRALHREEESLPGLAPGVAAEIGVGAKAFESKDATVSESITRIPSLGPEEVDTHEKQIVKGLVRRSWKLNRRELPFLIIGLVGAVLDGVVMPLTSIPLIEVEDAMLRRLDAWEVNKWCLVFMGIAGLGFLAGTLENGGLGIYGEKLVKKLRLKAFRNLLRQEIGYFDMKENTVGSLTSRLSRDAGAVKGLLGDILGVLVAVLSAFASGLAIGFASCWQLAFVVLAILPGLALGAWFETKVSGGLDSGARGKFAAATDTATEAIGNVSTVRHLGVEDYFLNTFRDDLSRTVKLRRKKGLVTSTAFGFSEFCKFMIWYAAYKAGGAFVEDQVCAYTDMFRTTLALMFGAISLGRVAVFAPDYAAAKVSASSVYGVIDRQSKIDPEAPDTDKCRGIQESIVAEDLHFEYPRRPQVRVLKGLSLRIEGGQTVAIVGASGQGKSTIIALLERFYSARKGRITFDSQDISLMDVQSLRSNIGYVPQEPELFNRSVFDNIAYGASMDDGTPISHSQVVEAAKKAQAHEFISSLPQGYDTMVGVKGDALSGGQKQRVAIARSLIREPPLLLLDEATSSLDSSTTALVQKALETAAAGRTTIVVAHRLSTIRHADVIVVVGKGKVIESGTHDELLRKQGAYARLVEHQLSMV